MSQGDGRTLTLHDDEGNPVEVTLRDGVYRLAIYDKVTQRLLTEIQNGIERMNATLEIIADHTRSQ